MGFNGSSTTDESKHCCCCRKVEPEVIRLKELVVRGGQLFAEFSDGSGHFVHAHGRGDDRVDIGCVKTSRQALKMVRQALAKEIRFQRDNSKRLMANLRGGRRPGTRKKG